MYGAVRAREARSMIRPLSPVIACAGLGTAMIALLAGLVGTGAPADPVSMTISDHVARGGGVLRPALAVLGAASLVLVAGLRAAGAPVRGRPAAWLAGWGVALITAAVLPVRAATGGAEAPWEAHLHHGVMIAAFVSVPVAALQLVGRFERDERWRVAARPVEWLTLPAGLGLTALTYVMLPGQGVMIGVVEGALLAVDTAILGVLAVRLLRLTWGPVPRRGRRPAGGGAVARPRISAAPR